MTIDWHLVRRAMLTQSDLFPKNPNANCMSIVVRPEQIEVVRRCVTNFYQGLQWADQCGIQGGYVGNRTFQRSFLIDDDYVLGVFDERSVHSKSPFPPYPQGTLELVKAYQKGRSNIKTLIVFEKEHHRLANSDTVDNQSKFLVDVVYPSIQGIRAKYTGDTTGEHWQETWLEAQALNSELARSHSSNFNTLTNTSLLSEIYHNPRAADKLLAEESPLRLFYQLDSPLNIDFDADDRAHPYFIPCVETLPPALNT